MVKLFFDGVHTPTKVAYHEPILRDSLGVVEVDTQAHTPLVIGTRLLDSYEEPFDEKRRLNGALDELYIIEGALSDDEVFKLYDQNILQEIDGSVE